MANFTFAPAANSPFQFQPQLDGQTYQGTIAWNIYAQRYYLTIDDLQNVRVATVAFVGSTNGNNLSLVAGYFTSTLIYREAAGVIEVLP